MECRLVLARAAADAGARIGAVRESHLALLRRMAEAGTLVAGLPLQDAAGAFHGSFIAVVPEALEGYLAEEPFHQAGIWAEHAVHGFRIAPLPYRRLPTEGAVSPTPTHTIAIAWDGTDEGALARRLSVRDAHLARVRPAAEEGVLTLGGALLNGPGGAMGGSVAITAHPDVAAAQAWWAADPYVTGGVWRDIAWHPTRFVPLPYRPLPGGR